MTGTVGKARPILCTFLGMVSFVVRRPFRALGVSEEDTPPHCAQMQQMLRITHSERYDSGRPRQFSSWVGPLAGYRNSRGAVSRTLCPVSAWVWETSARFWEGSLRFFLFVFYLPVLLFFSIFLFSCSLFPFFKIFVEYFSNKHKNYKNIT